MTAPRKSFLGPLLASLCALLQAAEVAGAEPAPAPTAPTLVVQSGVSPDPGMDADVAAAAADGSGAFLVVMSRQGILTLWRVGARAKLWEAQSPLADAPLMQRVYLAGTAFVVAEGASGIAVWSLVDGKLVTSADYSVAGGGAAAPGRIAIGPGGYVVAAGGGDREVALSVRLRDRPPLEIRTGLPAADLLAFSPDGSMVAVGAGQRLRIWDASSGAPRREVALQGGIFPFRQAAVISELAFAPDGRQLAVLTIDPATGALLESHALEGPAASQRYPMPRGSRGVGGFAFDATGSLLFLDDAGCVLRAAPSAGEAQRTGLPCRSGPLPLVVMRSGTVLRHADGALGIVHVASGRQIARLRPRASPLRLAAVDEETGDLLLSGSDVFEPGLARWNPDTLRREFHALPEPGAGRVVGVVAARAGRIVTFDPDPNGPRIDLRRLLPDGIDPGRGIVCGPPFDRSGGAPDRSLVAVSPAFARIAVLRPERLDVCDLDGKSLLSHVRPKRGIPSLLRFVDEGTLVAGDAAGDQPGKFLVADVAKKSVSYGDLPAGVELRALAARSKGMLVAADRFVADTVTGKLLHEGWVQAAAVSPDSSLMAAATAEGLRLYSVASGEQVAKTAAAFWPADRLAFDPRGTRLYVARQDGSVEIHALPSLETLVTLYSVGTEGDVVVAPDGHYSADRAGVRALMARDQAGRAVPLAEFDLEYNRPDLVLQRIGAAAELVAASGRRVEARRARYGAGAGAAPALGFADAAPFYVTDRMLRVAFRPDAPFEGDVVVAINDVPVLRRRLDSAEVPLVLGPGENRITAWLEGPAGVRGPALLHFVYADFVPPPGKTWFLGIGVSDYRQREFSLRYAAKDVGDAAAAWAALSGPAFESKLLLDGAATRAAIVGARDFLAQAGEDDTVVVYLASHGLRTPDGTYYFAPHDTRFADPAATALPYAALEDLLNASRARRRLLMMDTCHAGELDAPQGLETTPVAIADTPVGAVTGRGARRLDSAPAGARPIPLPRLNDEFVDLRHETGANVIAAAGAAEFALESAKWNNGVFTFAVLEALRSKAADRDRDARITASELLRSVAARVSQLTGGLQVPDSKRENFEFDYALLARREPAVRLPIGDEGAVRAVADAGPYGILVARSRVAVLHDPRDGRAKRRIAYGSEPNSVVVSPQGRHALLLGSSEVRLLDLEAGTGMQLLDDARYAGAFSADGRQVMLRGDDIDELVRVDVADPARRQRASLGGGIVEGVAPVAGGGWRVLLVKGGLPELRSLDAALAQQGPPVVLSSPPAPWALGERSDVLFTDAVLSPDGAWAMTTLSRKVDAEETRALLVVWDTTTGAVAYTREMDDFGLNKDLFGFAGGPFFVADGRLYLDAPLRSVIDLATGLDRDWIGARREAVWQGLAASRDGRRLYGVAAGSLMIWDLYPPRPVSPR